MTSSDAPTGASQNILHPTIQDITNKPLDATLNPEGIQVERMFATEGTHPFDEIEWEERTASITNPSGDVIFEQEDVVFPSFFSQLATNIVASKYFYGDNDQPNGSPADGHREYSLAQLVTRVAKTITASGIQQDIFRTVEDASAFLDDLVWLLVNQHGAFNSPVWFNVGLHEEYGVTADPDSRVFATDLEDTGDWRSPVVNKVDPYVRPQASACFIVDVEDSVDGIWKTMAESARLFKFGSGIGADWSQLRSTKDKLSGGGQPSGPVSFMKVQDTTGGTIKSGGKTRRAAIMQTLRDWHPDIMEFVEAKQKEEKKAWALIEQGYDGSFNGPAYGSVQFQNVNQSVRVTDEFMEKAASNRADARDPEEDTRPQTYDLKSPATEEALDVSDPAHILEKIAEGTHICGDPGLQFEDRIQEWHTCPNTDQINSSNPCSEYMFLDNSACNLASLNLVKYSAENGAINVDRLKSAAERFITAQEILVTKAGYPSRKIAENSFKFRPLGLGFANLGALLMRKGLPYDSNEGRSIASAITAIMHFSAAAQSARIARGVGPFEGYKENQAPFLQVMKKHAARASSIGDGKFDWASSWKETKDGPALWRAAREAGHQALDLGKRHGYRNAQFTVLAPTGTIGFYMDCDTTGIEPDIALVKYKLLAGDGDGMMKIVNQSVRPALKRLGYFTQLTEGTLSELAEAEHETQGDAILAYIEENDTIEGAPFLKDEHVPIFDCAFAPRNGERSIHWEGHVLMMAACQPFISGAISKTVNLPESATIDDIIEAYQTAWSVGLKAVAIYRENSKRSQPLNTSDGSDDASQDVSRETDAPLTIVDINEALANGDVTTDEIIQILDVESELEEMAEMMVGRHRLPDERPSLTHKFQVGQIEGYLNIGLYPEGYGFGLDGKPGEVFLTVSKQGSELSGFADAWATAVSLLLQNGVPLEHITRKFSYWAFEPSGFTANPAIGRARSVIDYVARYLALRFGPGGDGVNMAGGNHAQGMAGNMHQGDGAGMVRVAPSKAPADRWHAAPSSSSSRKAPSLGTCDDCGGHLIPNGACTVCAGCGKQGGCG